jgi:hypothetical protein
MLGHRWRLSDAPHRRSHAATLTAGHHCICGTHQSLGHCVHRGFIYLPSVCLMFLRWLRFFSVCYASELADMRGGPLIGRTRTCAQHSIAVCALHRSNLAPNDDAPGHTLLFFRILHHDSLNFFPTMTRAGPLMCNQRIFMCVPAKCTMTKIWDVKIKPAVKLRWKTRT